MAVLILALNHGDIALSSAKNSADGRRTTRIGEHDATGTTTSRVQVTHVHEESYSLRHVVVGGVHTFRNLLGGKLLTGLQSRQEHQNAERDIRECCQTHGYSFYPSRATVPSTEAATDARTRMGSTRSKILHWHCIGAARGQEIITSRFCT